MKYFTVSFKHCNIFCSNLCIAKSKEDVVEHYSEYECVTVKDAAKWEVESYKLKGMPIITL